MKSGLVTVVLPIYNVEKYLDRCIESVVNQTYKNLEIIFVDDGSPDNCPQICENWASKDKRIKVIHKQNQGLGFARNTGIENATGEYICFFDSDDFIEIDAIEKLYNKAKKTGADIVTFGYSNIDSKGNVYMTSVPKGEKDIYEGEEVQRVFLPDLIAEVKESNNHKLHMSAWASMYSMNLISNIEWEFVSERKIIAEDVYSLLMLYKKVTKVAILSEALYFYCDNDNSLTHTYRDDRYDKIKKFHEECIKKAKELEYNIEVCNRLNYPYYNFTLAALKMIMLSDIAFNEKKSNIKKIVDDKYFQEVLKKVDFRGFEKRIINFCMRNKIYSIIYVLLKIKNRK